MNSESTPNCQIRVRRICTRKSQRKNHPLTIGKISILSLLLMITLMIDNVSAQENLDQLPASEPLTQKTEDRSQQNLPEKAEALKTNPEPVNQELTTDDEALVDEIMLIREQLGGGISNFLPDLGQGENDLQARRALESRLKQQNNNLQQRVQQIQIEDRTLTNQPPSVARPTGATWPTDVARPIEASRPTDAIRPTDRQEARSPLLSPSGNQQRFQQQTRDGWSRNEQNFDRLIFDQPNFDVRIREPNQELVEQQREALHRQWQAEQNRFHQQPSFNQPSFNQPSFNQPSFNQPSFDRQTTFDGHPAFRPQPARPPVVRNSTFEQTIHSQQSVDPRFNSSPNLSPNRMVIGNEPSPSEPLTAEAIEKIRSAARNLESAAAELETAGLYAAADEIRNNARQLWLEARRQN